MNDAETVMVARASALQTIVRTGNPSPVANGLRQLICLESTAIAKAVKAFGDKVPSPEISPPRHQDDIDNFLFSIGRRLKRRAKLETQLSVIDGTSEAPLQRDRAKELLDDLLSTPRASEVRGYLRSVWAFKVTNCLKKLEKVDYLVREAQVACQEAAPGELEKSLAKLGDLLARRDKYNARLETLRYNGHQVRSLAAAAVDALGGPERLESCVLAAWQAGSKLLETDLEIPTVSTAGERPAVIEDRLRRVEAGTLAAGTMASSNARTRAELKEAAAAAQRITSACSLVERVRSADETAIKDLVALASACPMLFPERTSQAFYRLRPSQEQMAGYIELRLASI
jgi:hypothetical protein